MSTLWALRTLHAHSTLKVLQNTAFDTAPTHLKSTDIYRSLSEEPPFLLLIEVTNQVLKIYRSNGIPSAQCACYYSRYQKSWSYSSDEAIQTKSSHVSLLRFTFITFEAQTSKAFKKYSMLNGMAPLYFSLSASLSKFPRINDAAPFCFLWGRRVWANTGRPLGCWRRGPRNQPPTCGPGGW